MAELLLHILILGDRVPDLLSDLFRELLAEIVRRLADRPFGHAQLGRDGGILLRTAGVFDRQAQRGKQPGAILPPLIEEFHRADDEGFGPRAVKGFLRRGRRGVKGVSLQLMPGLHFHFRLALLPKHHVEWGWKIGLRSRRNPVGVVTWTNGFPGEIGTNYY